MSRRYAIAVPLTVELDLDAEVFTDDCHHVRVPMDALRLLGLDESRLLEQANVRELGA